MRRAYAHEAVLAMADGHEGAPGAAITTELCGSWDHDPPCPLAPHHTSTSRQGEQVQLRVLFAADPADEAEVRRRLSDALQRGSATDPEGRPVTWTLLGSSRSVVRPEEQEHGQRLVVS